MALARGCYISLVGVWGVCGGGTPSPAGVGMGSGGWDREKGVEEWHRASGGWELCSGAMQSTCLVPAVQRRRACYTNTVM